MGRFLFQKCQHCTSILVPKVDVVLVFTPISFFPLSNYFLHQSEDGPEELAFHVQAFHKNLHLCTKIPLFWKYSFPTCCVFSPLFFSPQAYHLLSKLTMLSFLSESKYLRVSRARWSQTQSSFLAPWHWNTLVTPSAQSSTGDTSLPRCTLATATLSSGNCNWTTPWANPNRAEEGKVLEGVSPRQEDRE